MPRSYTGGSELEPVPEPEIPDSAGLFCRIFRAFTDNKLVIQMNEARLRASAWVQCAPARFLNMIGEPANITGLHSQIPLRRTTMFRTISAALLAVSFLAAPALAGTSGQPFRTTQQAPIIKAVPGNAKLMNANAYMGRHHHRHHRFHHRHHRHHRYWR